MLEEALLYDYYGDLLTDKQKQYYEDYYFNNLTLQEISENNNVSRNNVHKIVKDSLDKLKYYENKLNLIEKNKRIKEIINDDRILELLSKYI